MHRACFWSSSPSLINSLVAYCSFLETETSVQSVSLDVPLHRPGILCGTVAICIHLFTSQVILEFLFDARFL